jgi:peptidoglycan LD-endopeptidase LytH
MRRARHGARQRARHGARQRVRHGAWGLLGLFALGLPAALYAGVPATAQTLDDLDRAERRVDTLQSELEAATDAYERTWARIEEARAELELLRARAGQLEREAAEADRLLADRARAAYMRGAPTTFETLFAPGGAQQAADRVAMLATLQLLDGVRLEQARAAREGLSQARALLVERDRELQALQAQLEADAQALQDRLAEAETSAGRIRSLVARQRRIDRGAQQGIYACIFDRGTTRFRDTWGAPRSGGRRHKGTDVFAAYRAPVYAFTGGVVAQRSWNRLGGLGLYLRGDDGNVYYYAHLDSTTDGGRVGRRVVAGELIARNGSTGNADRWAPHVHFELRPGGGAQVNPYPWLAAACF